jgi:serine-type D-Ala-D-Ala carboxypeptidase/endopeptidase (penicillin-binding protein 4)
LLRARLSANLETLNHVKHGSGGKTKKTLPAYFLGSILAFFLGAAPSFSAAPPNDLTKKIDGILGKPGLKKVLFSACIVRPETGEIIYQKNAHLALIPASNMKIVTSAAALEHLGPDFAFVTRVGLCGNSVAVIGSGDPLLGDKEPKARNGRHSSPQVIQDIAARLKEMGIASVSDILLDTTIFDSQRVHPTWPQNQLLQKYACEVSGLNYMDNCVEITAVNRGGKVVLSVDPPTGYVKLINSVTTGWGRKSWFSVDRTGTPCDILVQGNCRTQAGPYSVAVENPALFFGHLLREELLKAGIQVNGQVLEQPVSEGTQFSPVTEFTTPMRECLQRINKDSLGLAAEALFKTLGARANPDGKRGSWEGGQKALAGYMRGLGVEGKEFVIADGSGLSRDNRLSANALTRVLIHLSSNPYWNVFQGSLAVGGLDGTIENHFWEPQYRGRVLAKSGYIRTVRALSGVVRTGSGEYIFSFIANKAGNGARSAIDSSIKALMDWAARTTANP